MSIPGYYKIYLNEVSTSISLAQSLEVDARQLSMSRLPKRGDVVMKL
jgi:hypothetical protein